MEHLAKKPPPVELLLVVLVVALVALAYLGRIDALTIRGEESRRATVAMEMVASGDFVVPRQQGDPFFMSSRPPLQAWLIAGAGWLRGGIDPVAVRLPSVLAVLLTALALLAYARTFLSSLGGFVAAVSYATFGQVLELGQLGETDALFTLLLTSSWIVWHAGFTRRWPPLATWCAAYACVALATLAKGPQAPTYFAAGVGLYLVGVRAVRFAVSWTHLAGIGLFAVLVGAWLVPFQAAVGWEGVRHVFTGDVWRYYSDWSLSSVARHVTRFPLKVFSSLLPWSLLLVLFVRRDVRRAAPDQLRFFAGAIAVALVTVWLAPGAKTRFVMPCYPLVALCVGIVVDRLAGLAAPSLAWRRFELGLTALMVVAALGLPLAKFVSDDPGARALGWGLVLPCSVLFLALALVTWRSRRPRIAVASIALFMVLLTRGPILAVQAGRSNRADLAMRELRARMGEDAELVSFGALHHLFAFHFGKPIARVRRRDAALLESRFASSMQALPEPYVEIARVFCGRDTNDRQNETNVVIVGERRAP